MRGNADLIHCPDNADEFVYVRGNDVRLYNTRRQQWRPVLEDLSFKPNSITAGFGYIAAGGHRSQLAVRNMATQSLCNTSVGGSINNSMTIAQHAGDTRLLICNNDETIKVYSLPTLTHITDVKLPFAVNYCAVSGDGRRMVAVGDSRQGWLFEVQRAGTYARVATFTACANAAFSCAWSPAGDKYAVACQDGSVSVWDIRNPHKAAATLVSEQHQSNKGACRAVKFSPSGGLDLLLYSEHDTLAHVVCTRTFTEQQTLRMSPAYEYAQGIAGVCFAPDSSKLFVGMHPPPLPPAGPRLA
jgi:WD40 repeat protein